MFICPDMHKPFLPGIENLKTSKNHTVLSSITVTKRIQMMLSQHTEVYPTCTSDTVVNMVLSMMEGLNFMIPLTSHTSEEREAHCHFTDSYLIPSLRPVTNFWWNFLQKNQGKEEILTFGRRLKLKNSKYVNSTWFCSFQVCV